MGDGEVLQHHVQLGVGDVGRYVFLPGDPQRSEVIARHFDRPHQVAVNREYNTWSGFLDGELVSVTSTGIGSPSAAIAVEELAKIGATTFIRVGTAGAMQFNIQSGDLGIVTAAIRDEGTTAHYMPAGFPAVADLSVTLSLIDGARSLGIKPWVGISQTKDSFYGQHEPGRMPVERRLVERWSAWIAGGAICSEMECAAIFIVASILGLRAGGVMRIAGHPDQSPMSAAERSGTEDIEPLVNAAIAGAKELILRDRGEGRI